MRRLIFAVMIIQFLLISLPAKSFCYAADPKLEAATKLETAPKLEVNWDYLTPYSNDRKLDTISLHIMEKISATATRSVYRGITLTRSYGNVTLTNLNQHNSRESSAAGIGPFFMVRNEKYHSGKLSAAIDMSGSLILYDKVFPAGGRPFDFMWRIGPQLIYKFNKNSTMNIGYMVMHVSDGLKTHNPGYNAHGFSLGFSAKL